MLSHFFALSSILFYFSLDFRRKVQDWKKRTTTTAAGSAKPVLIVRWMFDRRFTNAIRIARLRNSIQKYYIFSFSWRTQRKLLLKGVFSGYGWVGKRCLKLISAQTAFWWCEDLHKNLLWSRQSVTMLLLIEEVSYAMMASITAKQRLSHTNFFPRFCRKLYDRITRWECLSYTR